MGGGGLDLVMQFPQRGPSLRDNLGHSGLYSHHGLYECKLARPPERNATWVLGLAVSCQERRCFQVLRQWTGRG